MSSDCTHTSTSHHHIFPSEGSISDFKENLKEIMIPRMTIVRFSTFRLLSTTVSGPIMYLKRDRLHYTTMNTTSSL